MAAAHAARDIGVQSGAGLRDRIMPGHDFSRFQRFADDAVRCFRCAGDAGKVHHLAEADRVVVPHFGSDIRRGDLGAGVLEAGHGRHAGGRGQHRLERRLGRVGNHQVDALEPEHVADFMRVVIDARRAVGQHRASVFDRRQHRRFDVDVPVEKARRKQLAAGFDDLGFRADAVRGVADERDAPAGDGDVGVVEDFVRADVDKARAANHGVRRSAAHRHVGERAGAFPKLVLAELEHGSHPFFIS